MSFPPNYKQERNNRARTKARKALEKQERREEKSAQKKTIREPEAELAASRLQEKEQK